MGRQADVGLGLLERAPGAVGLRAPRMVERAPRGPYDRPGPRCAGGRSARLDARDERHRHRESLQPRRAGGPGGHEHHSPVYRPWHTTVRTDAGGTRHLSRLRQGSRARRRRPRRQAGVRACRSHAGDRPADGSTGALPIRSDAGRRPGVSGSGTRTICRRRPWPSARRAFDARASVAGRRHVPAGESGGAAGQRRRAAAWADRRVQQPNVRRHPGCANRRDAQRRLRAHRPDPRRRHAGHARSHDRQQDVSRKGERRTTPSRRSPAPTRRTRS